MVTRKTWPRPAASNSSVDGAADSRAREGECYDLGVDGHLSEVYTGRVPTVGDLRTSLEFLQGTLEVLILRSLQTAPNHAYGISQFLERQSDYEFAVDNGSLYPALQRLLQRRWITSQWKTSPNGRHAKYYRLTALGRRQLLAEKSKWMRFVEAMSRVLAPER